MWIILGSVWKLTHLALTLFCWSSLEAFREIEKLTTHICVTREMEAVFHDSRPILSSKTKWLTSWFALTHWGWMTHICVSNLTIIGSDNGLSPGRRQAIIWTNAGISLIGPLGTNFSEILIEIHIFSFKKMHLNMSSGKWWPFCLGLNELK